VSTSAVGKGLPSVWALTHGIAAFAVCYFAVWSLSRATYNKVFAVCHPGLANSLNPVVVPMDM
jgi:hypothetical protein